MIWSSFKHPVTLYKNIGELCLVVSMTHLRNLYRNITEMDLCFNYLVDGGGSYNKLEIHLSIRCLVNFFLLQLF